ncbi:hypothetical protein C8R47DRAFT_1188838 [Mycena vitilis]|nr:hypothetical protein C8R47DRAFT_1188838 [Mycena vitilis]
MISRKPYSGPRALVFGIDVGTTFSGLSYSILEPGQIPAIRPITRFPGQQDVGGDSKVPTFIFYDREGIVRAEGAETTLTSYSEKALEQDWELAQWFKLHFRPPGDSQDLPPLPHRQSATKVLADFLRYLFQCAKTFIEETLGRDLWLSLENNTHFVLAHPNGWEGKQQSQMRDAAVMAGLITDTDAGHGRLSFVTEGEASLHFCIQNGLATKAIESGKGVVVVDAGGGTIDLSTYRLSPKSNGGKFQEIAPPQCKRPLVICFIILELKGSDNGPGLFQGSVYVTARAREYITEHLADSKFADDVDYIGDAFDTSAKLTFRGEDEVSVKFGTIRDNYPNLNIRYGQLKISGCKQFFEPSISAVARAIEEQCSAASAVASVSAVFLVGGFAASDWLFSELKNRLKSLKLGVDLTRPDAHLNKAVADGAVSFYIDHHVSVRVARFTYGLQVIQVYDPENSEHTARSKQAFKCATGQVIVPGTFNPILKKGMQVCETTEFRSLYTRTASQPQFLQHFSADLWIYNGHADNPQWMDTDPESYRVACKIEADISRGPKSIRSIGPGMPPYYEFKFHVVLSFGLTELKARIAWMENGVEKRGPAKIVY